MPNPAGRGVTIGYIVNWMAKRILAADEFEWLPESEMITAVLKVLFGTYH